MSEIKTSDKLLHATIDLLKTSPDITKLTAREIVAHAGVNLAMINYCFGSKDQLISMAVSSIISEDFKQLFAASPKNASPKERLAELLYNISETVLKYKDISRLSMPYLLLEADIEVPLLILPLVTACFNGTKEESECRLIAYELVSFLQLVFYQSEHFKQYSGIDSEDPSQLRELINKQMQFFFNSAL